MQPALSACGFDTVDLSGLAALQSACAEIRSAGRVDDDQAATIRVALDGAVLPTASGGSLRVLFLADEGFIMRQVGPNRMSVVGPRTGGMNDHGGAATVHADQDVYGTPLTQLMDGRAPELFVHDSPDGHNHDAAMLLVNLWIPLQQVTQPLVLADGRSLDRRRHQLRYGLPTGSFLDRDEDQVINDIWHLLHDDAQQWYFRSDMDHRSALVFNTLSTPHGAGVLPGEDIAERCSLALEAAESAVASGDVDGLLDAVRAAGDTELTVPTTSAAARRDRCDGRRARRRVSRSRRCVRRTCRGVDSGIPGGAPSGRTHVARDAHGGLGRGARPLTTVRRAAARNGDQGRCVVGSRQRPDAARAS